MLVQRCAKLTLIAISYSKAADLIMGIKCTKCPQKQFKSKHEVYGHVFEFHLANVQGEVINQNNMAEENMDGVEEEIPQKGIEPPIQGIKIVETYGNPNGGHGRFVVS